MTNIKTGYSRQQADLANSWPFHETPKPVGWWRIGLNAGTGTQFAVYHKPSWFHIKMIELVLGWKWEGVK